MTSFDPHRNFVYSSVGTAPSPASSGTTVTVQSGDGALFPDPASVGAYNVVVCSAATATAAEVCRVTAKSGDRLTWTRAQESSAARAVSVGDPVFMGVTAKTFTDIENSMASEYSYAEFSSISTITGANIGTSTAATVVTTGTVTYSGTAVVMIDFFAPAVVFPSTNGLFLTLWSGSTVSGVLGAIQSNGTITQPANVSRRLTPAAGSTSYTVKAHLSAAGTVFVEAQSGSAGYFPGYIRVTRAA